MGSIQSTATITSKGQITLPKPIRQLLGVDAGGKISFELTDDGRVVVERADSEHDDPVIASFLELLERGIEEGRAVPLPNELAESLIMSAGHDIDLDDPIDGEVEI